MTRKELDRHFNVIKTYHRKRRAAERGLMPLTTEYPCILIADDLEVGYIKAIAELAGDKDQWIYWYIYENDFGRKEMEAGFDGKMKRIKSTRDLLNLIEEGKKR